MNKFVLRQSLLLLLTATIWGVAFVAQSISVDYIEPYTFNAARNLIGGLVLLPYIGLWKRGGLGKVGQAGAVLCLPEVESVVFCFLWPATYNSLEFPTQQPAKQGLSRPCILC